VIHLAHVTKHYGDRTALSDVSLEVAPEKRVALIGPSGCGKSTLLRVTIGLIVPDSGTVTLAGEAVKKGNCERARLRTGYVIQDGGLFPHLSARENVVIMARHLGWDDAKTRPRVAELAELAGLLPELLERYPAQLSGGQRQRVGIMRALMLDPDVLLMDEPLGALDPILRSRLQEDLVALFQRLKKTVLIVTHDMGEAAYLADEVALMRAGTVVQKGRYEDLVKHPSDPFVTEFIAAQRVAVQGGAS
jgi:osmoprotectant transport system ATP-binding protein